ncbi:MAG: amidohydrolase family protein [Blastocatellia bacterium]
MIIDSHCHVGAGIGSTGPGGSSTFKHYLARAVAAGIDRTVIFSGFYRDYQISNRIVGRMVLAHPDRFDGFAFVHAERDRSQVEEMIDEAVSRFGFKGIKVHRRDAPITREVCEVARLHRLPILYDVMGRIGICHRLAADYPDVNFIIPHLGSFYDDLSAQRELITVLKQYENLFTDTAGVRHFDLLARTVHETGPDKVLFGTDGPWLHPGNELDRVTRLGLRSAELQLVLGENYLRLTNQLPKAVSRVIRLPHRTDPGYDWPDEAAMFDHSLQDAVPPAAGFHPPGR